MVNPEAASEIRIHLGLLSQMFRSYPEIGGEDYLPNGLGWT